MNPYYITFGYNHFNKQGQSLGRSYTIVYEETYELARKKAFTFLGSKWAFMYESAEKAGVSRFGLEYIKFEDLI